MKKNLNNFKKNLINNLINNIFLFGFYSGKAKFAPGTFGTVVGCIIGFFISYNFEPFFNIILSLIIFLISWPAIYNYQLQNNIHDDKKIVIDEIIGVLIPLAFIPANIILYIIVFILFRFFDIYKLFPASYYDSKNTAISVIMDDVVAGIQTVIILSIVIYFI